MKQKNQRLISITIGLILFFGLMVIGAIFLTVPQSAFRAVLNINYVAGSSADDWICYKGENLNFHSDSHKEEEFFATFEIPFYERVYGEAFLIERIANQNQNLINVGPVTRTITTYSNDKATVLVSNDLLQSVEMCFSRGQEDARDRYDQVFGDAPPPEEPPVEEPPEEEPPSEEQPGQVQVPGIFLILILASIILIIFGVVYARRFRNGKKKKRK